MAPRRTVKSVRVAVNNNYKNLSLNNVLCPICRSILIEPVSLPCSHGFCLSCFENTMANTNLVCPLCRIRIGSWLRTAKKEKKLVNTELWKAIKESFPQQVKNKVDGIDDNFQDQDQSPIRLSTPGEIRREYEIQKLKEDQQLQKEREAEAKASEELIRKLKEQEDYQKSVMEEKLRYDEAVAKQMAKNWSSLPNSSNASSHKLAKQKGPLDRFVKLNSQAKPLNGENKRAFVPNTNYATKEFTLINLSQNRNNSKMVQEPNTKILKKTNLQIQRITAEAEISDSSDSIESECRYFKPIDYKNVPPSKKSTPIKITPKFGNSVSTNLESPNESIDFAHNYFRSAFTRVKSPVWGTYQQQNDRFTKIRHSIDDAMSDNATTNDAKYPKPSSITLEPTVSRRRSIRPEEPQETTPKKRARTIVPVLQRRNSKLEKTAVSPPFLGFETKDRKINGFKVGSNGAKELPLIGENDIMKKVIQEREDLEFAKKLQEELNRSNMGRYSTRQGCNRSTRNSNRQVTLDEMIII